MRTLTLLYAAAVVILTASACSAAAAEPHPCYERQWFGFIGLDVVARNCTPVLSVDRHRGEARTQLPGESKESEPPEHECPPKDHDPYGYKR